jgi:esterase/lipase superfamily enzyme
MDKVAQRWRSPHLGQEVLAVRWGHAGTPLLLYPTAGGDAEEGERFKMIHVLEPAIEAGRIRVYACDSVAGRTWSDGESSPAVRARTQNRFDDYIAKELVPAIRKDCGDPGIEVVAAGASIGAFNALASICRHPDLFRLAICMSGTYNFDRWMDGQHPVDYHHCSPLHFLPTLPEGDQLAKLRKRFVLLASGEGDYEAPWECWWVERVLGPKGIPNRVDLWGKDYRHDWTTWRAMLPKYVDEFLP